jgi:endoglucanase
MLRRPSAAAWRSVCAFFALTFFALAAHAQTLPTAQTVFNNFTVGWNLGNTLEAQCGETAWGNPATSQQLINAVKAAGFNAIRIPAAWNCHTNPAGSTTIDATWMARVKQVVDYAYSQNMYVILNIHWDGGWLEEHPLYANQVANNQRQTAFWTQIATTFRDYNERMLFAGTNEVHADYNTPTAEHNEVQQSYNQTFVNAVRATGGNNASRTLVVQTYNTNIWHGINFFNMPTDTIANRLIVEVHHYDPYDYTLNPSGSCLYWGAPYPSQGACTWGQETYVDDLFNQARVEWVAQGIPVIVGEYGVATRPNLNLESRNYYLRYNNEAAYRNGIKTFYWDTGVLPSQTNGFALFNRNTGAVVDQGALDAIMLGAGVGNPAQNYTLTTAVNGSGSVARSPSATQYAGGTQVTLTATPASGNQFAGWTGDLSGITNPQSITMLANRSVTANFVPTGTGGTGTILREYWLNVTGTAVSSLTGNAAYPNSPTGSEQLTSLEGPTNTADNYGARVRGYIHPLVTGAYTFWLASDDGGDLLLSTNDNPANATRIAYVSEWTGSREWTKYASQKSASVTLTAGQKYYVEVLHKEATGGDNFAVSWQGPGIAQAVIGGQFLSPFVPTGTSNFTLTVAKAGTGSGTVNSAPSGISCGSTCSASYSSGTSVTLTAAAASGSSFTGWSGACTGTGACTVSMTAARSVTATFNSSVTTYALTVSKAGTGAGTVTSNPSGINCGSTCSANYANATSVTLTAAAASGSSFTGWSGACTGTGSCTVSMTAARAVTATFNGSSTFSLAVTKAGTGTGTVTSSPTGINCGSTCSANYASGTSVTLSAAAASGSTFGGWSGACTGTGSCVLAMTAARNVTATFNTSGTGTTCANPITFTNNTGNFNTTGGACYRTSQNVAGWGCSNFDGRTVTVGGVARTCGQLPLTRSSDGYYYFSVTAGSFSWASLYVW